MTNFLRRNWGWLLLGALVVYRFNNMPAPIPLQPWCITSANQTYNERLKEALEDPTVWQFDGATSPYDYADDWQQVILAMCIDG
jgi:hypothetical protein